MTTVSALDWSRVVALVPQASEQIPAALRVTRQTADNWLEGRTKPSADNAVALMASFPQVADAILEAAGINDNSKLSQVERRRVRELLNILVEP